MTKGERIKQARLEKEMTLEELAEKCNTTRQAINKYEKGTVTNIPSDKIELLCKALDVTPQYIMGWEEPEAHDKDTEILDMVKKLPEDKQKLIRKIIESMIEE